MMRRMNIRDRLELRYGERQNDASINKKFKSSQKKSKSHLPKDDISKYVTGSFIPTADKEIFVARHTYDMDHQHGKYSMDEIANLEDKDLRILSTGSAKVNFELNKTLFLDTETTGLAGGSGTAAFLIGIGYFYENKYIVEQFFMRDYDEEAAILNLLAEKTANFDTIVTFNGRSFDIPLLETRMILNRIDPVFSRLRDIDLLHPARRIWGLRLSDCRLGTLENEILSFQRAESDIPGSLIPGIYFDYLRFGNADKLYKVFYHNEKDVVSMVGLLHSEYQCLTNPTIEKEMKPLDLYQIGKYFERSREWTMALVCLEKASPKLDERYRIDSLIRLSIIHKRNGRWSEAVGIWKDLVSEDTPFSLQPFVELAMYYEHREKKIESALIFSTNSLDKIPRRRDSDIYALEHRIKRLNRKISRKKSK